jgi:hypothetical protein
MLGFGFSRGEILKFSRDSNMIFAIMAVLSYENSEKQWRFLLVFCAPNRPRPRISAGYDVSLAVNFREEQRKQRNASRGPGNGAAAGENGVGRWYRFGQDLQLLEESRC